MKENGRQWIKGRDAEIRNRQLSPKDAFEVDLLVHLHGRECTVPERIMKYTPMSAFSIPSYI